MLIRKRCPRNLKALWLYSAMMLFLCIFPVSAQQAQTEVTARATLVAPLEVERLQNLNFGSFPAGASPVTMSPVTGETHALQVDAFLGRVQVVSGLAGNPEVTINAPETMVMTGQETGNQSETLTVSLLYAKNTDLSASTGDELVLSETHALNDDGNLLIIIGGSIDSNPAEQETGQYQGEISISVELDI
ncbi:DUF4402 domain-containing protein [Balneolaceae bacterium ANBcel3]|nr:DUF4402 domain-containing protein [Balneolaceae bacterium ANBcel3]